MIKIEETMSERPNVTLPGTVERIIKPPNEPEKAQITVKGADHLCRDMRIDNTLRNENGDAVSLQAGARVDVTLKAESEATTLKSNGNGNHSTSAPMNRTTLSTLAQTKPSEPLLEHEIRLRAYDLYEQQGRMDGHSVEYWLHAEAEILGKIFSRGA